MDTLRIAFVLSLVFAGPEALLRAAPADPGASPEAVNLLNWLGTLPGLSANKVVSGQLQAANIATIQSETGIWVGLMGDSFINARSTWLDDANGPAARQAMLDHWNAGGIVNVYMPMHNPKTQGSEVDFDFNDTDMVNAVTPGHAINTNLNAWLDRWAVHARWLGERRVPLIVRILHEGNQRYFWYGQLVPANYQALWNYIFNYLTVTKGLHNILFGYGPAWYDPGSDWATYYPGGTKTDIVGIDLYKDVRVADINASDIAGYTALAGLGKPIAFTEYGPKNGSQPSTPNADYRKMMSAIKALCPNVVYWFSWNGRWSMRSSDNSFVSDVLTDSWTINRDEIPNLMGSSPPSPAFTAVDDATLGTGQNQFEFSGTWNTSTRSGPYLGADHYSNVTNNFYQLDFTGNKVEIVARKAPDSGKAAISIDGGTETTVDFYSATALEAQSVWSSPVLASGTHTVKVRITGTKNASSTGYYLNADRVNVTNTVDDATSGTGTNQFNYSGTWNVSTRTGPYLGADHYSNVTNNYYQVTFTGTQVQIYSKKGSDNGIAAISIDGGAEVMIDCYASTVLEQRRLWTSPVLAAGSHTIKVRVTGTKNPVSTGYYLNVDRWDITP